MAFERTITARNGIEAGYWKLVYWWVHLLKGEAYAEFQVFKDRDHATRGGEPVTPQVAKLRLSGIEFEVYFGEGRDQTESDQAILYRAAGEAGVISDFGEVAEDKPGRRDLFAPATAVLESGQSPKSRGGP